MKIPFYKPDIEEREIAKVSEVIRSGWLTQGKIVEELEKEFAKYVGAKYAVAVDSCTSALYLAVNRLDLKKGSKIALSPLTFAASASAIIHNGHYPYFIDIGEEYSEHEIDATMVIHYAGVEHKTVTKKPVIYDSAHLVKKNQCLNKRGFHCFSFYPTKPVASLEGGMICTNNKKDAEWFRKARLHGINADGFKRYQGGEWDYAVDFVGWKMNMTDVQAQLALSQLRKLDKMNKRRQEILDKYNEAFDMDNKGLHLYPMMSYDRGRFIEGMKKKGINCAVHFPPLHLQPAYKDFKRDLRAVQRIGDSIVSIPFYSAMSDKEVDYIIKSVKGV